MQIEDVREAVDSRAQEQPEEVFLISAESGANISCLELREESIRLSRMLRHAGLEKGDKAAFLMDNGLLYSLLFLGSIYGGYVAVPLNVRAGVAQLSYMVDCCDAKVVFVEQQYTGLLNEALQSVRQDMRVIVVDADAARLPAFESDTADSSLAPLSADDTCLLMYSSGSTGKPKGAIHTQASILAHGRNSIEAHQLSSSDRSLLVLPLYHINAECVTLIPALLSGGSVVVPHRFVVSRFWDWIDDYRPATAEKYYRRSLQFQPEQPVAANNLAYLMLTKGENVDVALTLAQTARRGMPNSPNAADTLAWAYYQKHSFAFARDLLEEAVKNDATNQTTQYHLGLVYRELKDKANAQSHLNKAISLAPDSATAKDAKNALQGLG